MTTTAQIITNRAVRAFLAALTFSTLALVAFIATSAITAQASEGGGNQYFLGAASVAPGVVQPPGDYLFTYAGRMSSTRLNDARGNQRPFAFRADSEYLGVRYAHRTDYRILGGQWGFYVVVPYTVSHGRAGNRQQTKRGFGDITIAPLSLGWQSGPWHWTAGVDFTLPTGDYNRSDLLKIGRNYYSVAPNVGITFWPGNGLEVSTRLMTTFNTTNPETDYRSGREFIADYFVGYRAGSTLAGVMGYSYVQIADDTLNGTRLPSSRGRAHAVGLALGQGFNGLRLTGTYSHEYAASNRPQAERALLRLAMDF